MQRSIVGLLSLAIASVPAAAAGEWFVRGDADGNGELTVSDPVMIYRYLFRGGLAPIGCLDAADVDDDGKISLTDAIDLLAYLFQNGSPPAAPFPVSGEDWTEDDLGCEVVRIPAGEQVFVLCIDRSSSMKGIWERVQDAVAERIASLPSRAGFAIILFDEGLVADPEEGTYLATGAAREWAISRIERTQPGIGSCGKPALLQALDLAGREEATEKRILFYTDGYLLCDDEDLDVYQESILDEVAARNTGGIVIDAIGIDHGDLEESFLMTLASENGGTYTELR